MQRRRRSGLLGIMLAACLAWTSGTPTEASPPGNDGGPPSGNEDLTITLVTGDRVTVHSRGGVLSVRRTERAAGRGQINITTMQLDGHLYAIPSDAGRLLGRGRLDERMFDLTQLVAWQYDDAHRRDLPLLAAGSAGAAPAAATVTKTFARSGMEAVRVNKADAGRFWHELSGGRPAARLQGGMTKLWLDGRREALLDQSVPQIGAPEAWKKGLTGKGVTVAVLDSGYDKDHPDINRAVTEARGFTDLGPDDVQDRFGHGTHVTSTILGSGEASNGRYKGVAPDAKVVEGKVLDDTGHGSDSWIIAGMEWAAARAKIVNMSLGHADSQGTDPAEQAVNSLTATTGTLFVISAGNSGPDDRTVASPASADAALAVGAVDGDDRLAGFSSRGPRLGDYAVKPEITAPGVDITAAVPLFGRAPADAYGTASGTSMAAPHVTGAAAILAQQHPRWSATELKGALTGSAKPASGLPAFQQGAGRVDVARAVEQPVTASPANLSTYLRRPDAEPVRKTVTYANDSGTAVTLKLAIDVSPYGGGSAGGSPFRLDADTVTVPANGTAQVPIGIDPAAMRPGAALGGVLEATSGTTRIRTVIGAYREPKSANLTVKAVDRSGKPAEATLVLHDQRTSFHEFLSVEGGTASGRFPAGAYNLFGALITPTPQEPYLLTLVHTPVTLTGPDRQVMIDTREAKQPSLTVDEPTIRDNTFADVGVLYQHGSVGYSLMSDWPPKATYVLPVRQSGLTYFNHRDFFKEGATPENPSPYHYAVVDYRKGGIPENPTYVAKTARLARVTTTYRAQNAPSWGLSLIGLVLPTGTETGGAVQRFPTPFTVTEYLTPNRELHWWRELDYEGTGDEDPFGPGALWIEPRVSYGPGKHSETWNAAAMGPALKGRCSDREDSMFVDSCAARKEDTIGYAAWLTLFSDSVTGHFGNDLRMHGTARLSSGGKVLGEGPLWSTLLTPVPHETARYRLDVSAARNAALSNRIEAHYGFSSASTSTPRSLPLMAVRFSPAGLDGLNRARPGSVTRIPIRVERNPGAPKAGVKSIAVSVSYDDAATWQKVDLRRSGAGWAGDVKNPASGFVSLRATVTDTAGNTADQTIVRAYALGG